MTWSALAMGALHEKAGRMEEALTSLRRGCGGCAETAVIHRRIGVLQFRRSTSTPQPAAWRWQEHWEMTATKVCNYQGLLAARQEDYAGTRNFWSALAQRRPEDARLALNLNRLHYLLGKQYVEQARYADAISEWNLTLEMRPEDEALQQDIAAPPCNHRGTGDRRHTG